MYGVLTILYVILLLEGSNQIIMCIVYSVLCPQTRACGQQLYCALWVFRSSIPDTFEFLVKFPCSRGIQRDVIKCMDVLQPFELEGVCKNTKARGSECMITGVVCANVSERVSVPGLKWLHIQKCFETGDACS